MVYERNNKYLQRENKKHIIYMIVASIVIFGTYIYRLVMMVEYNKIQGASSIEFIRLFNFILALLGVLSCMLCYKSNQKEELFFIGVMYGVFILDIGISNIFDLTNKNINEVSAYVAVGTSIIRILIGILAISSCKLCKTIKLYIINNKIKFNVSIILISLLTTYLEYNKIMFNMYNQIDYKIYNTILLVSYSTISIVFFVKSIKNDEYTYAIIGSSVFMFATKAIYAILGEGVNSAEIKLTSVSITYVGFIIFIVGLFIELTQNIKKNKELEKELNLFYKIVNENKYSNIVIQDESLNVIYSNENVYKEYIKDRDDSNIVSVISNEIEKYKDKYGKVYLDGDNNVIEYFIQYFEKDQSVYYVTTFRDISVDYKIEKIKQQEQIKNEFLANISHELKTPLNIIYSTIQLISIKINENDFTSVYSKYEGMISLNCQRMLRLINNIVDITKFDIGYKHLNLKNYDIVQLVEDITISTINYAKMKNINLVFDTEIEELIIKCDGYMIERVMLNLISNAIKFTKGGGNILIKISSNDVYVSIKVIDDGIGIPIEIQDLIFERFVQVDKSLRRENEGSGIGLSIVKSIIDLCDGDIILRSDGENGSEFEILLPNKRTDESELIPNIANYVLDKQNIKLELSDIYELNH